MGRAVLGSLVAAVTLLGCDCDGGRPAVDAAVAFDANPSEAGVPPDASAPLVDAEVLRCSLESSGLTCPVDAPFCCQLFEHGRGEPGTFGDGSCATAPEAWADEFFSFMCRDAPDACSQPQGPDCPLVDTDGDGHDAAACGGDDCADDDATVHPGAADDVEVDTWLHEIARRNSRLLGPRAITLDAAGTVHILSFGPSDDVLQRNAISLRSEAGWSRQILPGDPNFWATLADGRGHPPTVVVQDPLDDGVVRLSLVQPPDWEPAPIIDVASSTTSELPALDPSTGSAALLLMRGADRSVLREEAAWMAERVSVGDALSGWVSTFTIDRAGAVHFAFTSDGDLWYATNRSGGWTLELVDCVLGSGSPSIASDSSGHAHIVYPRWSRGALWYATNASGSFTRERIAATRYPSSPHVAVGDDDSVHVLYVTSNSWGLISESALYAERGPGGWSSRLVARHVDGADLVATSAGQVHVAYGGSPGELPTSLDVHYARLLDATRVDQNCDGVDGVDADRDTWPSLASGGEDCDDGEAAIHPGATGYPGDHRDMDCDGLAD